MRISLLPDIRFVGPQGQQSIRLSQSGGVIDALSKRLSERLEPGSGVGLIFRTTPEIVLWWLGALKAGLRPLIVQYPTLKQSRAYWDQSVAHTISAADLKGLICDSDVRSRLGKIDLPIFCEALPEANAASDFTIDDFSIIQLSSGTTGHRKAVEFTSDALRRHVADYNQTLELRPDRDRIVSWLPLYHDMGYVACFVMPLMLGIPVTMMDPEAWNANRGMLFDAIEQDRGTVCFMPNFGFEVMAAIPPRPMPTMRFWISCSEPVKPTTTRRFLEATGTPDAVFAACYAMAENIFAVSQSRGLKTHAIDGVDVASCGPPIAGVEVKTVDGEIWVRSPTSIDRYLGGAAIADADGFYPTGDLGSLIEGELYVTGRSRDLMIQAGKKFMLSDVDAVVNEHEPRAKGRVATLAPFDEKLGTQTPIVLIETPRFWEDEADTDHRAKLAERIADATGLETIRVHYVPPRFLTKTSSGKINRVLSLAHWNLRNADRRRQAPDWRGEVRREFATKAFDRPVGEILDSLSLTILSLLLAEGGVALDTEKSIDQLLASVAEVKEETGVIRIVSLADRRNFRAVTRADLDRLGETLGAPVTLEHVCLPPTPLILSDLVFDDWFSPRLADASAMRAVRQCLDKLRRASLIIVDDVAEFCFPPMQSYPVLSHRLERSEASDLLAFRWQRYTEHHDQLPLSVVAGSDLLFQGRDDVHAALSSYLDVPIFRIAAAKETGRWTRDWEFKPRGTHMGHIPFTPLPIKRLTARLLDWLADRPPLRLSPSANASGRPDLRDLAHFCSHYVKREGLDQILETYDSFAIAGREGSVAYIARRLAELDKPFVRLPSYAPEALEGVDAECVLACGPTGSYRGELPAFPVMDGGWGPAPRNAEGSGLGDLRLRVHAKSDTPPDWLDLQAGVADRRQAAIVSNMRAARRAAQQRAKGLHRDGEGDEYLIPELRRAARARAGKA